MFWTIPVTKITNQVNYLAKNEKIMEDLKNEVVINYYLNGGF